MRIPTPRSSRGATRSVARASCRCAAGIRSKCSTSRSARPRSSSGKGRCGEARSRSSTPRRRWSAGPGAAYHALAFEDSERGRSAEVFDDLVGADAERERAVADGMLVEDTRIRDALRAIASAHRTCVPAGDRGRGRLVRGRRGRARRGGPGPRPSSARRARPARWRARVPTAVRLERGLRSLARRARRDG